MTNKDNSLSSKIGLLLKTNLLAKIGEIVLIFLIAFATIKILVPFAGDNLVLKQAVIWFVNILMLFLVWLGIKFRGEKWSDFGLNFRRITRKELLKAL